MSHSRLLLPEQARPSHGSATPAEDSARKRSGPGNRDLLASLGTGKAMPEPVQAKMEKTLGADFSGVRLHESPLVAQGGAEAAASGNKVAFAPGKLNLNSPSGLELLGHELSHVASQARGEVSGHGLVQDAALEHRADADGAKAMHAFDPVSGGELTPMSTGPAPGFSAGPVQAKKGAPTGQERADHLKDSLRAMDLSQQVQTMKDISLANSMVQHLFGNEEEHMIWNIQRGASSNFDFWDELLAQQIQAAHTLNAARAGLLTGEGGEMDEARATFLAKYSPEATQYQAYSTLVKDVSMRGKKSDNDRGLRHYLQKTRDLKQSDPDSYQAIHMAQDVVSAIESKNPWVMAEEGGQARSPERGVNYADYIANTANQRTQDNVMKWYAESAPKKQSLLSRLFHRRKRH